MKKLKTWSRTVAGMVCLAAMANTGNAETISAGISSNIAASGAYTAGTIDSCYVTAVFGANAYIQDGTGGIYLFKGANATYGIPGIAIGDQITSLGNGGFYYYTAGTQFEYEPTTSTTAFSGMLSAGTYQSIPASYYAPLTLSTFNSAAAQGGGSSQGMQNQLVTLGGVTITLAGASGGTFAASTSYTMTDASGNTGTLYVNAASGIVGQAIPTGAVNVSGVFQDFHGASELLPRGTYDLAAVPEPATTVLLGGSFLGLTLALLRRRRVRVS